MVISGHSPMTAPSERQDVICELLCACGNSLRHESFYTCDLLGRRIGTGSLRCCERCGKITDCITGKTLGKRSFIISAGPVGLE